MFLARNLHSYFTGYFNFKVRCFYPLLSINDLSVFIRNGHADFTGRGYDLYSHNRGFSVSIDRPLLVTIMEGICSTLMIHSFTLDPAQL